MKRNGREKRNGRVMKRKEFLAAAAGGIAASIAASQAAFAVIPSVPPTIPAQLLSAHTSIATAIDNLLKFEMTLPAVQKRQVRRALHKLRQADHLLAQAQEFLKIPST